MASKYQIERDRGLKEASQQLAALREKWPLAFPVNNRDVRPVTMGAAREISATMGWPLAYTLGVLGSWKMASAYCQAVLSYDQRIGLDGAPAEAVDAKAKNLAARRLAELSARKAAKKAENIAWPAVVKSKCPHATRRDARAIARPSACSAVAPARIAALQSRNAAPRNCSGLFSVNESSEATDYECIRCRRVNRPAQSVVIGTSVDMRGLSTMCQAQMQSGIL